MKDELVSASIATLAEKVADYHSRQVALERDFKKEKEYKCSCNCKKEKQENKGYVMAVFIQHESCPRCKSKDNLARYNDGSAYCFGQGCGYFESAEGQTIRIKKKCP